MPGWLEPARFADPERKEQAAILGFTMWLGLGVIGMQGVIYALVPTMASSAPFLVPEALGMVGVLVAVRRGWLVLPATVLLVGLTGLVTAFVFFGGGLEFAFPPVLGTLAVLGALMLGARAGALLTVWAVVCTVAVYLLGSNTALILEGQDPEAIRLTVQLLTVLLGGALVTYSTHRLSQALRNERAQTAEAERALQALDGARRYTAEIVQSMAEGVLVVRADGRVHAANDAAVRLFAVGAAERLGGVPLAELLPPEDLERLARDATPGATAFGESRIRNAGREIPVRVARSVVRGEGGEAHQVIVLSDITDQVEARRRSEEAARAAEAANRAKSQFLANMSHELRTPLNAVIGYADMLLDEHGSDPELGRDLERIRQAGRHLLSLINDVLDMSKIEAGRMEVFVEPVNLAELAAEVEVAVAPTAAQRGNTLALELADDLPVVQSDGRKILQILLNLLSNAVKFTEGGSVALRASAVDGWIRVEVEDTGIGIEPEAMDRLFSPFVQGDDSTSRRYGGTGLGLALSRRFAELLGGTLTARSTPGTGSVFTLVLPVRRGTGTTPVPEIDPGAEPLVLCVDDDPPTLDLLGRLFRRQGLRVASASSGADALRVALEHPPSVITLDVHMPEMDGWTLLRRMREFASLKDVPVVMVSMADHERAAALTLGASDYLVKPVEPDRLVRTVGRYLAAGSGRVLVVDDDPDIRELLRRLLAGEGWEVTLAGDGAQALERLEPRPDLVVLDLMMPGLDGFGFVERMRADARWRDLPIVVLTAMDLTSEQWDRLAAQTSQILGKSGHGLQRVLEEVRRFARTRGGRPDQAPGSTR